MTGVLSQSFRAGQRATFSILHPVYGGNEVFSAPPAHLCVPRSVQCPTGMRSASLLSDNRLLPPIACLLLNKEEPDIPRHTLLTPHNPRKQNTSEKPRGVFSAKVVTFGKRNDTMNICN